MAAKPSPTPCFIIIQLGFRELHSLLTSKPSPKPTSPPTPSALPSNISEMFSSVFSAKASFPELISLALYFPAGTPRQDEVAEEIQSQYKAAGERAGERVEVAIGPGDLWYLAGDRMRRHQQVLLFASEKLNVPNLVRQDLKNLHLQLCLNVTVVSSGLEAFSSKIKEKLVDAFKKPKAVENLEPHTPPNGEETSSK
eukprot:CAMPEP_0168347518 /NCGR_PEP_ID=MMETSP0213-20121227/19060_1 /TAXON_ID=151035 /ORGANISM="Euplotes harpa, Strain FSP1.4" /LENGTH=196 /DNA_ID=CAMNT_0008356667 /DNA_START=42 /DNA_END=632 /DNA_ORIENTATION=+